MPTITRDIGMGCGRSVVIRLVAIAIGLPLGLCGVMSTVWIATSSDSLSGALFFSALLWLPPFLLGGAWFLAVVLQRTSKLDAIFVPLGLAGKAYMTLFRQYHGIVYGRQVDVYLYRGPILEIEITTPLNTRLGVTEHQSDTTFFADLGGKQALALTDPNLAALSIYAYDEPWTRALLADTTATDALRRLTELGSTIFTRQQVILRPGALKLMLTGNTRLFGLDINAGQANLWVDDLYRVLQSMEALPAPQTTFELSSAEHLASKLRARNPYFEAWLGLAMIGVFVVIAIIIFAAVFLFTA